MVFPHLPPSPFSPLQNTECKSHQCIFQERLLYCCKYLLTHCSITHFSTAVPPEVEVSATLTRVVVGNSTTLTCTVTRSNPMGSYTYTWVHNNSMIPGETSSMLTVGILTESDVGIYHCEVTNSAGLNGSNTTTIELGSKWLYYSMSYIRLFTHSQ